MKKPYVFMIVMRSLLRHNYRAMKFYSLITAVSLSVFGTFCFAQEEVEHEFKPGDPVSRVSKDYGTPTVEFPLNGKWIQDFGEFVITSTNQIIVSINYKGEATVIESEEKQPELSPAELLLLKAMEGDVQAQCRLAYCFQTGTDFPENKEESIKWYTSAALQNDVAAQHNLGIIYMNGEGVKKDYIEAYAWAILAEQNGNNTLQKALAPVLDPEKKIKAQTRAQRLGSQIKLPAKKSE